MRLIFRESAMVKEFYTLKCEIDMAIEAKHTAEWMLAKYIDEFNSATLPDEQYILDEYINGLSKSVEIEYERIKYIRSKMKELKKELKSLGIKVK